MSDQTRRAVMGAVAAGLLAPPLAARPQPNVFFGSAKLTRYRRRTDRPGDPPHVDMMQYRQRFDE